MKLLVINNIASGFGEGAIYDFIRAFTKDGDQISIRSTDGTTDLTNFLNDAHKFDVVVASGGDGTIAAVSYYLRNTNIPILPFPAGTANLLALNLESPVETHALSKLAREGKQLNFDMGEINIGGKKRGFSIMAGAGYDSIIMKDAQSKKHILGPLAYYSAALSNPTPPVSHLDLTIDGKHFESEGVGILIANFSKIQFDLSITHHNRPRDGKLDVIVLKANHTLELLPSIVAAALDRDGEHPDRGEAIEVHSGKTITVQADPPMEVQYDGEITEHTTPFTVSIIEDATRFILSDTGYKIFSKKDN